MNNLLILFMLLYAISATDLEKFKEIADQFKVMFGNMSIDESDLPPGSQTEGDSEQSEISPEDIDIEQLTEYKIRTSQDAAANNVETGVVNPDSFSLLYQKIKTVMLEKDYGKYIDVDKIDEFIYFRFKDGILFYPDLPDMRESSYEILLCVGDIIKEADNLVSSIEISGYTAKVSDETDKVINFRSWDLSVNRALTVLKYLINNCDLPQSKMSIAGFAHFQPSGDDTTPEGRALNRRVEIRIARFADETAVQK
jgi:chemotaxis protein MotB